MRGGVLDRVVAYRLLYWCAANLGELDGTLLLAGAPDVLTLTPRQLCNVAFVMGVRNLNADERAEWLTDLNTTEDPWAQYSAQFAAAHEGK